MGSGGGGSWSFRIRNSWLNPMYAVLTLFSVFPLRFEALSLNLSSAQILPWWSPTLLPHLLLPHSGAKYIFWPIVLLPRFQPQSSRFMSDILLSVSLCCWYFHRYIYSILSQMPKDYVLTISLDWPLLACPCIPSFLPSQMYTCSPRAHCQDSKCECGSVSALMAFIAEHRTVWHPPRYKTRGLVIWLFE